MTNKTKENNTRACDNYVEKGVRQVQHKTNRI